MISKMTSTNSSHDNATLNPSRAIDDFVLTPPTVFPYKEQQLTARARIEAQMQMRILMLDGAMGYTNSDLQA